MKTTVQKELTRLAGLLVLSLLVVATGVQAALAAVMEGTGAGTGTGTIVVAPAASSGLSSTTVWIVAGAVAAALLIAGITFWTLARRRQQSGELASVTSIGRPAGASAAQQSESSADSQRRAA